MIPVHTAATNLWLVLGAPFAVAILRGIVRGIRDGLRDDEEDS